MLKNSTITIMMAHITRSWPQTLQKLDGKRRDGEDHDSKRAVVISNSRQRR